MSLHLVSHPTPVEGCFGCKVQNVGVQTLELKHGRHPSQKVPVKADDGPRGGKTVGYHQVHWDGRQDAVAKAPTIGLKSKVTEY